jgi:uncharacterized protein YfcZ (UPF0381/DUF406 family)
MGETRHEVRVCKCGDVWKLILKRSDAGLIELPAVYAEEAQAIKAAHKFIRSRRADSRFAHEVWFCLAPQEPCTAP